MTEKVSVTMKKFRVIFEAMLDDKSIADISAMKLKDDNGRPLFQKPSAIASARKTVKRIVFREMGDWQERFLWSTVKAICQLKDHYRDVTKALRDPSTSREERSGLYAERRATLMDMYKVGVAPSPKDLVLLGSIDKDRARKFAQDVIYPLYREEADNDDD